MDTVEAFSYLQGTIPALISRMKDLAAHKFTNHTEYYEACHGQKPLRLRCPTNHSIRPVQPNEVVRIEQKRDTSNFDKTMAKAKSSVDSIQCSGRKRRVDEDLSIGRNKPFAPVNKRHKVIIEYDGHIQKVLEEVVRDIAICRGNIRRAKISVMQTRLLPKTVDKTLCLANHQMRELDPSLVVASSFVRRAQTGSCVTSVSGSGKSQKKQVTDFADEHLKIAHELCETAAHQALRTGKCVSEIEAVLRHLEKLRTTVNNEIRRPRDQMLQQMTEEETSANTHSTSIAARLARVAAISTGEPLPVGTSIIEVDYSSYLSAESS
ncbi:uncharacterized protein N7506_001824 [Penicillium brevicompactum]|uniref:uncharacterized protein n=1 Tax=Penicillium brevicompactum TaxID=5074 RepID=UPI0025408386|nr:uncharacterized protein N7506_001824 [Penicillium brevicompactum]KAJ5348571.1 hypothetical protein N7506_001824 [Penicillium brevicompactum]